MKRDAHLERLGEGWADAQGLQDAEAEALAAVHGPNAIVAERRAGWLGLARDTLRDPMIWFLVGTALLFVWLGDVAEAAVLAAALLPIVGMDAYLHRRTEASTEGLRARLASTARAIRGGRARDIPATDLVPGDLVVVPAGEWFPADGLILAGEALQADESSLTGEAMPVRKTPVPPAGRAARGLIDTQHWGMAGTRLLTGEARMRVALTGVETLYGEIARLSSATRSERTPLQEAISRLVKVLLALALLLCAALAVIRYVQGYGLADAILSAVTLAIAALPEEFPVVFSFFLGLGVYRLARRQALVRRAVVVENIGRVSCICTDKTGTLTEGRLTLDHVLTAEGVTEGEALGLAATASRAETSDPLDEILLSAAAPLDGRVAAVFPFTEDRLREVAVLETSGGGARAAMKGAPEAVLGMCAMSAGARSGWLERTRELAGRGHKVIAVASMTLDAWDGSEPAEGFRFAGLLGFSDPVRPGVAEAVREAQGAGIRVVMITGDHVRTGAAIARDIGIGGGEPRVLDGAELEAHLAAGGRLDIDVVARCAPSQKLALVVALRAQGELVAVTGDGVNDAPALRGADVGIAMGQRGTRSAREAASIVLLDDDFATIVHAIAEGRQLFTNLRLSFAYLLMMHAPLVATAALVPLLGYPLLYLPIHVVWLELILHPTAMLVFQNLPAKDILSRGAARGRPRFFTAMDWTRIGLAGGVATAVVTGGYVLNLGPDLDADHARSMAMAVLILSGCAVTAALTRLRTRPAILAALLPAASVAAAVQIAPLAALFHLSPLHLVDWAVAIGGAALVGAAAALPARP
ncbi:cation-transporting P-type ATPase [Roseibacterium sp. SDUM158017]|uniref:cation-translocating P-type ATPase n=1 Tax=Roseicyclus salinarum TaxID=3036773 RepID=UPI002415781B|nr:cation-transporting P-type ATPase [Roseibacterium sp. SDUM158017]MDG4647542.1 cation-transporting P-type ATPase [Roseibacterium sp. SDUM158017]